MDPRRSVLIGLRLRATEQVRVRRLVADASTHGFVFLERFHTRDVGRAAPEVVAYDGRRPSTERLIDDPRLVGDPSSTAAGLAAVREAEVPAAGVQRIGA